MRSLLASWLSLLIILTAAGAASVAACAPAAAQNPPVIAPRLPPLGPQTEIDGKILDRQRRERQARHEHQLRADAAQLLALAQQLKASMDKTDKNVLSIDVVDTAGKIEKLAKKIKDSMRSGR